VPENANASRVHRRVEFVATPEEKKTNLQRASGIKIVFMRVW